MNKQLNICIVSDGTDTITQSRELAFRLTEPENITRLYKDEHITGNSPDLAIGVGFNVTDTLLNIKKASSGKTKIAIILDPLKNHEDFDFIILPSYEPYKIFGHNVIRTTGLINFVSEDYLAYQFAEYSTHEKWKNLRDRKLKPPYLTVIIGGRHTGGTIDDEDTIAIAARVNEIVSRTDGTALITTSPRTEVRVSELLREEIKVPYHLYDYKKRDGENPYGVFLALADKIIVTGESVRMLSEACSSGKPALIYCPLRYGFQYKPLIDELITNDYATDFLDDRSNAGRLDEALRVASIIKDNLG